MGETRAEYMADTTPFETMVAVPRSELDRIKSYADDAYAYAVIASKGQPTDCDLATMRLASAVVKMDIGRIVRDDDERRAEEKENVQG